MALETLSSSELLNFIMYDSTPAYTNDDDSSPSPQEIIGSSSIPRHQIQPENTSPAVVQCRKKRRRRPKVCKNKEEAENQRMTHIAVERNRRKQMNEHLAVLRSLMPESYVQRGDQASIVGGAIEFVKELEHILQSLEAKKYALQQEEEEEEEDQQNLNQNNTIINKNSATKQPPPFAQFFAYPQFSCSQNQQLGNKFTSQSKASIADIEVTLIETHANIRILSRRRVRQLSKIVVAFQSVLLTILHLNLTTLDSLVLYSISAKVEEGCQFSSADDIAGAVHHMLRIIEEESILCCQA
ncbi:hypothetical protein RD792_009212 [Penstemon davidsonii]|uniref:BHLH domain-containing protein n=1 Tax=Penstemon davidsonii TaxID=160366 RepID=A0ABR0DB77_9LAMI|nr:hypothetical protein RD792_009212 [Penstemon davidsonii]